MLDDNGEAVVNLPDWFEALNKDFRYQLTCIGGFAQVYISQEISDNQFKIAGGNPDMKVSWMVTGIRHDVYAEDHRIQVEQFKNEKERGKYLYPEGFGFSADKRIDPLGSKNKNSILMKNPILKNQQIQKPNESYHNDNK